MLEAFKGHVKKSFPELLSERFLLACSGGLDSVVLAHCCTTMDMEFALAHCNFRLRGEESDGDERFVANLAKSLNKYLFITHFDTIGYVNKNKVSVQMAARELRYTWFAEIMKQQGIDTLVTAHQADDNLETFFINLSRGTGIDGLKGIPPKTDTVSRPLLAFSRAEILEYAKASRLEWREDSSNRETYYLRNKIRHEIAPILNELHPAFQDNFDRTQAYLGDTALVLEAYNKKLRSELFQSENGVVRIEITDLQQLHPLKPHMHLLLKDFGFTAWNDIEGLLTATSGKEVRSKTHRLVKDRKQLLLEKLGYLDTRTYHIHENQREMTHPFRLKIECSDELGETAVNTLYVDKETLKYPLTVRKWQKGDYFHPLGMKGRKKLSKYFKDEKVDVISKDKQWLLCSDNQIVWVVGKRADERFKVRKDTRKIVKFELI
ncbi:tRNA lysidine(34) synthetase TilS [Flavobacteriaceae bacterium TP-CH-4]|uniref:tRNA(Ile)-lysidine synthase n=1 Tax=Pelagihabitans pacificus TaxID=2696054 RepID=A0A967E6P2_9FLAO|nr:tRNA lysidine(34) synthetase TilS [Pelagihabitans pacificus]NHF59820.1 tRNA lysidine(34) synthetase TilS [Pelagihabitans pacificus]